MFQSKYKDIFLDKAKQVFSDIDTDNSGSVSVAEIASVLRKTLPDEDVEVKRCPSLQRCAKQR